MKKVTWFGLRALVLGVVVAGLVAACSNPSSTSAPLEPAGSDGQGGGSSSGGGGGGGGSGSGGGGTTGGGSGTGALKVTIRIASNPTSSVQLNVADRARTVFPAPSGFSSFKVSVTGGSSAVSEQTVSGVGGSTTFTDLTAGVNYNISVNGYTAASPDTPVAVGTASATVVADAVTPAAVSLGPKVESQTEGTFRYTVTITALSVQSATLTILKSSDKTTVDTITLTTTGTTTNTRSLATGEYLVRVNVNKGDGTTANGATDVVHIYKGMESHFQATIADYTAEAAPEPPAATGSLAVTVGFGDYDPIAIAGADALTTLSKATSDSVTLTADAGYTSPAWYVDGGATPVTNASITLAAASYVEGAHSVTFTGVKNTLTYSRVLNFTVVAVGSLQNVLLFTVANNTATEVGDSYEDTLDGALSFITSNASANAEYLIELYADQAMTPFTSQVNTFPLGVKITLRGKNAERKITWAGAPSTVPSTALFTIGQNGTLVLDDKITIDGQGDALASNQTAGAVFIQCRGTLSAIENGGGTLIMKTGSTITNLKAVASAVSLGSFSSGSLVTPAVFSLEGGEIVNNTFGYGVYTGNPAVGTSIIMTDGKISNNSSSNASDAEATIGVNVGSTGTFVMNGGEISGNRGVGVNASTTSSFTMSGGTISGNTSRGVATDGTFTMIGGTISGNGTRHTPPRAASGIQISTNAYVILNGPIIITDHIALIGLNSSTANAIYLGSSFSLDTTITLSLSAANSTNFRNSFPAAGRAIIKGGTPESPTTISSENFNKFPLGKAYSTNSYTTEMSGGTASLTLENGYGVAKWTTP